MGCLVPVGWRMPKGRFWGERFRHYFLETHVVIAFSGLENHDCRASDGHMVRDARRYRAPHHEGLGSLILKSREAPSRRMRPLRLRSAHLSSASFRTGSVVASYAFQNFGEQTI